MRSFFSSPFFYNTRGGELKGGATFVAQTKVSDSNLERFAAEIQVCCRRCLNAQMSGFMLSRCLASLSRRHKSLLRLLYKSISLALTFRMQLRKSNYFFGAWLASGFAIRCSKFKQNITLVGAPVHFKGQPAESPSYISMANVLAALKSTLCQICTFLPFAERKWSNFPISTPRRPQI